MARQYKQRNKAWADKVRDKIKTAHLVDRLTRYATGDKGPQGETIKLESGQIKAIEILLSKTLPALTSADITQHQEEPRTYDDIKAQLIQEHGEPLALLLLKEIDQATYIKLVAKTQNTPAVDRTVHTTDSAEDGAEMNVTSSHTQPPESGPKLH